MNESTSPFSGRLVFGLILLSLGLMWTADNLGFIHASHVLRWWPLLLLVFGLTRLFGWGSNRQVLLGGLCTAMGVVMLASAAGWLHAGLGLIWPLAMVALGIEILLRGSRAGEASGILGVSDPSDYVRTFALMGGASTRCTSQSLRGAELSAFLGGVELDLRDARPADGRVVVDAFAFMGGIDIAVPAGWDVEFHATPLIGGMADTRTRNAAEPRTTSPPVTRSRRVCIPGAAAANATCAGRAARPTWDPRACASAPASPTGAARRASIRAIPPPARRRPQVRRPRNRAEPCTRS